MSSLLPLAAAIALPLSVGFAGSLPTRKELAPNGWYRRIHKPSWTPPTIVFPVAWTTLYVMMGTASFIVYKRGSRTLPLACYAAQLLLNALWSPLFFGMHAMRTAFIDATLLVVAVAACIGALS